MKVSYSKELRTEAKKDGLGLATIDYVTAKGGRVTMQAKVSEEELKEVAALSVKIFCRKP
jgi:hypothetical protein